MDASTLLQLGGSPDFDTEMLLFVATAAVEQTFIATRDGFIFGWLSNATNYGISVNTPMPGAVPGSTGVTPGFVFLSNQSGATVLHAAFRFRFKQNDTIRVKTFSASTYNITLYVGYPRSSGAIPTLN